MIKVEPVCPGILRGIVYCAVCGAKMWHQWANYRGRRRRYYRCGGNSRRTCQAPFVPAEEVEGVMLRVLGGFQLTDELRAAEAEEARRVLGMEQTRPAVDAEAIRGQLERLGEAYADGVLSKARYEQRRDALRAQLAAAPVSTPGPDLEGALTTLGSMPALIAAANVEERGDLARAVFSHVWASGRLIDAITPRGVFLPLVALWKLKMGCLMGFRLSI